MKVLLTQHPVGQGGMYSGIITARDHSLHWVYDCGSNQRDALTREIHKVESDGPIDLLFLSHLDADHVNGVDQLLSAVQTTEVVLPLLTPLQRAVALSQDAATGRLTGNFVNFAENPAAWLSGRGVSRVTFVEGGDDPGPEGGVTPVLPRDPLSDPDLEGALGEWTISPKQLNSKSTAVVQRIAAGATRPAATFDWVFAPYAHLPSKSRLAAFRSGLVKNFGSANLSNAIQAARSGVGREKLRSCYDEVWKDHNLVSMALYAGPVSAPTWPEFVNRSYPPLYHPFSIDWEELGWLSTGDFQLKSPRRRDAFLKYYGPLLERVDALVLPHHGAEGNFDSALLSGMTHLSVGIASAGPDGRYGHPSGDVADAVRRHGATFRHVSDQVSTLFQLEAE